MSINLIEEGGVSLIKHVVFFKLKDGSADSIERTATVLRGLEHKIEQLRSLEIGQDILRTERSYDIALIAVFESLEDLQAYQVHPEHKKVIAYMNEVRESSIAVDFEF